MEGLVQSLSAFLKGRNPGEMSKADASAWLRHERDTRGNTGKTLEKKGTLVGALFSQTRDAGGGGYHARVWLPLLGLFTGARLNELGRLVVGDIQGDPVPHFDIRRAKNSGSLRAVPLHPQLVELGFLEYVEALKAAGQECLWPCLRSGGDPGTDGDVLGRWFSRYLHQGLGFPATVVFHSFRHSFRDFCRNAGIARDVHHQLTGHASGAAGDAYGAGYSLDVFHGEVSRIRLPLAIPKPLPYAGSRKVRP